MHAMILEAVGQPLQYRTIARPRPGPGQVLVKVAACGVCRTDLHVVDGDLTQPRLPIIPGHEIVGCVEAIGTDVEKLTPGDRVGIPWLGHTCGRCSYCRSQRENLCDGPLFTGYQIDGGYAEYTVAEAAYCFPLPAGYADT
ncbi:MAG: alcohol dehydrogenase catalytic domain-containing protein, partial [Hyphomicrobiaceae bacterium]|nr:alcohol dehydrogenase catalytic domain-containing protein [Hyphomicrobiaceae bacterium]